ncbi:hypothetical protein IW261DRAFT_1506332 [Armillaria novae-zelandiae]|uniref:Uncharacterized protein n=1 Tax=Armillaria novae-zelandiae TaxID=153914 RepID=A0AA39UBR8_9AGAR|nr:hypothetical protein IW261DRAFT_1506332 [Armillaria novae-zelandiae]
MFGYLQHFMMLAPPSRKSTAPELKEETTLDEVPLALTNSTEYTLEQYKRLKHKVDYYLLPLLWLCVPISHETFSQALCLFSVCIRILVSLGSSTHGLQWSFLSHTYASNFCPIFYFSIGECARCCTCLFSS